MANCCSGGDRDFVANVCFGCITLLGVLTIAALLYLDDKRQGSNKTAANNAAAFALSYQTLERAYDAIVKETNTLREERNRLQKRLDELEVELVAKKSKTTGEVLDHKAHICFRCYQNLDKALTKDEMIVEENLLLERARIMKFTRWRLEILPNILEVK